MISKENIEQIKEMLYMNCKSSRICCLCMAKIPHDNHCFHPGTLRIGTLEKLKSIIDNVLADTTPTKFRVIEALHFLDSKEYIKFQGLDRNHNLFSNLIFYCTSKLWIEQKLKEENPELDNNLRNWY